MEYKVESSLWDFPAWSGGKDTLDTLKERNDVDAVEMWIEGLGLEDATDTTINDILWFERDMIAESLGYKDWDAYEEGRKEDEDEFYLDCYGEKIEIGMTVHWHDEAGKDEDGNYIDFVVVGYDIDNDGYFNLAYEGEENPERWAWHDEIETI